MGGGLRKPADAYTIETPEPQTPSEEKHGKPAAVITTDEELDRLEALEAKREEEMAQRQKVAVDHVVENLFPYAPVKVQTQKYPPSSPHAGKGYLWITVDEDEIKRRGGKTASPVRYPVGVAVDAEGNVFVSESSATSPKMVQDGSDTKHARKISAASIMELASTKQPPATPKPPRLVLAAQNSLVIRWYKSPDTTVDRYEVQYRLADSPNNPWASLVAVLTVHDVSLDNVNCHTPYAFRVRAHNPAGWSEFSAPSDVFWTLPGIPGVPSPPVPGTLTNTYISLFWSRVDDHGAPPVVYTLEIRECTDDPSSPSKSAASSKSSSSSFRPIYEGTEDNFVVSHLEPKTTYIFRLQASNTVGSTPFVETRRFRTLAHGRPELVELTPTEQSASYDRWVQCWDPKTEQVFYFNKYTSQRVTEEPRELVEAREQKGLVTVEETPEMLFRRKRFRFHRDLRQNLLPPGAQLSATLPITLVRERMYDDTLAIFRRLSGKDLVAKPKISFEGEAGIDSGGLTKDWYLQLSKHALDPKRRLFKPCDHGQYEIDPASSSSVGEFLFLGKLIAKAIFDRQSVDLPCCDAIFKYLLALPIHLDDLAQMDAQFHKSLVWMLENEIAGVLDETFSVELNGSIMDLKENGRDLPVTDLNKTEYVDLIVQWRTTFGVQSQLDALGRGIGTLIPLSALRGFTLIELRQLINGKPTIDVEELRANTVFQGGYDEHTQVILWLWQALREFTPELRGLFLKFMTGTTKIPLDGFDPPLNLTKSDLDPQALPRTHTCFNQLVLPEYTSYDTLVQKITLAITHTEGFELS